MTRPSKPDRSSWVARLIAVAVVAAAIGLGIWFWPSSNAPAPERFIQEITLVQPPPPPPPEPEEPIMEEEPEIIQPTDEPQVQPDVEQPSESPSDAPAVSSEAAGLDRPADAGSDSFRLAAGQGGGLFGRGGGGGGGWGSYVETHVRRALQRDPRTRGAQGFIRVSVVVDDNGRFGNARLRSSTGDAAMDAAVRDVLASLSPLGRGRPPGIEATTVLDINMRRTGG